jgi:crotonobetainyl-CoA:carnitine CoA-transferase CaiB-like acyl-CoA transferase
LHQLVVAPAAAMLMADFGADVIKLEPPDGDAYRYSHLVPGSRCRAQPLLNAGIAQQAQLGADLKTGDGLQVLQRLLDTTDVFITSLPPFGTAAVEDWLPGRLSRASTVIYASFTAHGETGPEVDKPGFDATSYWARCSLMDLMRANEERSRCACLAAWATIPPVSLNTTRSSAHSIAASAPASTGKSVRRSWPVNYGPIPSWCRQGLRISSDGSSLAGW